MVGMTGPAIQATGFFLEGAHVLVSHLHGSMALRHMAFEPGFLMIVVGFVVSLFCIPLALEVARAAPDELDIPVFGAGEQASAERGLTLAPEVDRALDH